MRTPALTAAFAVVTLLAATGAARAQDADDAPGSDGDEIMGLSLEALLRMPVTSATGGLELESDVVPANVITISREDIIAHGWRSVAEVLEHVPGLYVIDDHVLPSLSVRGINGGLRSGSRIVKVMINGVEVSFRPDLTAMLGPEYIPFLAVQRIEIARGPLSALYGANAFLATVNIVTREATSTKAEVALQSSVRGGADANTYVGGGVSALASAAHQGFDLLLALHTERTDRSGLRVPRTFDSQSGASYQSFFASTSHRDLSRPVSLFGQGRARSRAGTFSLQGGFQRLDAYGEFQAESVLTHRSRHGMQNFWSQLKHELALLPSLSTTLAVGYGNGAPIAEEALYLNRNVSSSYQTRLYYKAVDYKATVLWKGIPGLQALLSLDGNIEMHHGFNYRETYVRAQPPHDAGDKLDTRPPIDVTLKNLAPSLQLMSSPLPDLHLIANGRLDYSSTFARQYSWRAGASYRVSRALVAKLITGRAFQAPSPVLLYGLPGFGVANSIVGSKSPGGEPLEPQTVQSAEAVISALPSQHASIVASVFWQRVEQKIEFLSNAVGYRARNRRRETDLGAEVSLRGSFGRWAPHLSATSHRVLSTDEIKSSIGPAPPHYPVFWGMAGLRVAVPEARLDVDATVRAVGPRGSSQSNAFLEGAPYSLPAYQLTDVVLTSAGWKFLGNDHPSRFTLGVRNLFDAQYAEPGFGGIDLPNRGRTVFFELHQTW